MEGFAKANVRRLCSLNHPTELVLEEAEDILLVSLLFKSALPCLFCRGAQIKFYLCFRVEGSPFLALLLEST